MRQFWKLILALVALLAPALPASAHLPRLERGQTGIKIEKPEISQAFYGWLQGKPAVYQINSSKPFLLYLNILSPRVEAGRMDFSAKIYKDGGLFAEVLADNSLWSITYEPFANDYYANGPEFEQKVDAGNYKIEVFNSGNNGNYVLAVGKTEDLSAGEFLRTLAVLPAIKEEFFGKSWWQAYNNLVGLAAFVFFVLLSMAAHFVVKFIKRRQLKNKLDDECQKFKNNRHAGGAAGG